MSYIRTASKKKISRGFKETRKRTGRGVGEHILVTLPVYGRVFVIKSPDLSDMVRGS